jgi:hypothetical protein
MPDYQYATVFKPAEEGGYIVTGRSRDSSSFRTSAFASNGGTQYAAQVGEFARPSSR